MNNVRSFTKKILLANLNLGNIDHFYDGLSYRYNSVVDLISHGTDLSSEILRKTMLQDKIFYCSYIIEINNYKLPLLDYLEIDAFKGGILSSYLHDIDRDIVEGKQKRDIQNSSKFLWDIIHNSGHYSFVFEASKTKLSKTSRYFQEVGFKEENIEKDYRCFYNKMNNGKVFLPIMKELVTAINGKNTLYQFDKAMFTRTKNQQTELAREFIIHCIETSEKVNQPVGEL